MKISAVAFEPQDTLAAVEQTTQQRSAMEHAERAIHAIASAKQDTDEKESPEEFSSQKLQHLTEALDSYMSSLGVDLKFHIDERTDLVQVEVRDPKTDKLIRKIPADEMLDLAASIENMVGLFLNKAL